MTWNEFKQLVDTKLDDQECDGNVPVVGIDVGQFSLLLGMIEVRAEYDEAYDDTVVRIS